ncbi:hypothetical protein [Phytomonospora endophytica]|uniref:LPXTG cell wall anchor domain-containing protein n=1 Tax=Phytomonospora endophytica TaxID=714109 RepID=A0A841G4A2_9ACTN|nr:hypothetical protein [Phytomonospora endophytica]MBB6038940.1 hypothetical protein [Phytomonospora endophytica]
MKAEKGRQTLTVSVRNDGPAAMPGLPGWELARGILWFGMPEGVEVTSLPQFCGHETGPGDVLPRGGDGCRLRETIGVGATASFAIEVEVATIDLAARGRVVAGLDEDLKPVPAFDHETRDNVADIRIDGSPQGMPNTGTPVWGTGFTGAGLVALGFGALWLGRRRPTVA